MTVQICVGSSCHLKGSYDIVEALKKALKDHNIEDKVILKATFCLGKCGIAGVSVKVDEEIITGITLDNFAEFFKQHILEKIN